MAGLERLQAIMYHEKQQEGSMLCAQHALNSLLQGNFFTAPDLSQIAQSMDDLEASYDDANTGDSTNMDDTGFFSVQVLEKALNVWGLDLARWRSEDMKAYQDHPHTQLAFILNYHQHWFTLRRFGPAFPSMIEDPGDGHWYNLNSFLAAPEWVSKLYLGMVLQQAESEGYSVFAVVQTDPHAPLALIRTDADDVASTLPEPSSSAARSSSTPHLSTTRTPTAGASSSASAPGPAAAPGHFAGIEGFEDEDMELQAALQASLGGGEYTFIPPPRMPPPRPAAPPLGFPTGRIDTPPDILPEPEIEFPAHARGPALASPVPTQEDEDADAMDPVEKSMLRNRRMLERVKREQEFALREQYDQEAGAGTSSRPRRQAEEEEEENIRRAIAESEAMARTYPRPNQEEEDAAMDVDDSDDEDYVVPRAPVLGHPSLPDVAPAQPEYMAHRVYDDDDAELQAALKASLEHMPEGFTVPEVQPPPSAPPPGPSSSSAQAPPLRRQESVSSVGTGTSTSTEMETEPVEEKKVDLEEMRRRRLARFG
ncbi:Josephin-domain-containing protein [Athelia psychrophila]|uniref:ubiquitinyl hydrolase 1 n=1 Tax=Athelia psychrophila TaxID=1759441 RepID=A0A166XBU4_9AGAM|nr:Josephin-domain-containing protein [Fibularhizoctonia sp. CBS 109695]